MIFAGLLSDYSNQNVVSDHQYKSTTRKGRSELIKLGENRRR